jgi:hypothetical protein
MAPRASRAKFFRGRPQELSTLAAPTNFGADHDLEREWLQNAASKRCRSPLVTRILSLVGPDLLIERLGCGGQRTGAQTHAIRRSRRSGPSPALPAARADLGA